MRILPNIAYEFKETKRRRGTRGASNNYKAIKINRKRIFLPPPTPPPPPSHLGPFDRGNRIFERRKTVERPADACRRGSSGRIDTFRRYSTSNIDVAPFSITRPRDKAFPPCHPPPPPPPPSPITPDALEFSCAHTRLAPLCPALLDFEWRVGILEGCD